MSQDMQLKMNGGLYTLFFKRLEDIQRKVKREILPFPDVFEKLCRNFSITKRECWEILFLLKEVGFVEIVPFHGIKLNK